MKVWRFMVMVACGLMLFGAPALADGHDDESDDSEEDYVSDDDVIEFLREQGLDHVLANLERLADADSEEYEERLDDIREHVYDFREVREEFPELAEAMLQSRRSESEAEQLAERIRESGGAPSDEDKQRLMELLNEVFELRMKRPEFELERLRTEIVEIEKMIERRRAWKERIVERRMGQLLDERDGTEWW